MTKRIVRILFSCALLLGLVPHPVSAVPISPDKYYLDVVYGTEITETLHIMTRTEFEPGTTLYLSAVGMEKIGELHERNFYVPDPENMYEPANWITLSETEVTADPNQDIYVDWTLTPPTTMGCGTNLAALMLTNIPLEFEDNAVSVREEIISQIHLNVIETSNGLCLENRVDLQLLEFFIDKTPAIFNYDDVPFVTRIENNGNLISRNPQGFIEIFGFGDKITIDFNEGNLDIYPGTVRRFDNEWSDDGYPDEGNFFQKLWYEIQNLRIGRYEARLGLTKNVEPPIVSPVYFWVFPWRVILAAVVLITFLIVWRKAGRKKDKK